MADAELAGAEALPADQRREVVVEGADVRARLAEPEGGLDDGDDAGRGHRLVVVGGADVVMWMCGSKKRMLVFSLIRRCRRATMATM